MKKHETNRKGKTRRSSAAAERELSRGMGFVAVIGGVERLRNPEFWR